MTRRERRRVLRRTLDLQTDNKTSRGRAERRCDSGSASEGMKSLSEKEYKRQEQADAEESQYYPYTRKTKRKQRREKDCTLTKTFV